MFYTNSLLQKNIQSAMNYVLKQRWAINGPRATRGPPQRFQWPAEAFRTIFKSETSSNSPQYCKC